MKSKITGGATEKILSAKILNKYNVDYYKCVETGFIQTEEPYWLEEAYSSAITKLDIGLAYRNEQLRDRIIPILTNNFNVDGLFLDYAGGYGLFTRMMRDKGYDFYHTDPYCQNIFAEYFDLEDIGINTKFELVTSFEVFEHLVNPIEEITKMLSHSDNLFFTTEIQPANLNSINDWWYFIPETGQHISLYTIDSLKFIADKFNYEFYTDGQSTHLFTKTKFKENPFSFSPKYPYLISTMKRKVERYLNKLKPNKETLLQKDWQYIKDKMNE